MAAGKKKDTGAAGGPARARIALTLAAVLAVNGADTGTISSTANNLESAFGVAIGAGRGWTKS